MFSLGDDQQLNAIMSGAADLSPDKRAAYLQRIVAHLQIRCGRFTHNDVLEAVQLARNGLAHTSSSSSSSASTA